jgi:hypothetical protein
LRTDDKDLTPWKIMRARQRAKKAFEAWWTTQLSVTPKCHASESHACDQLELQWGTVDFCQDWVKQLCQLGLKNDQRTKTIGDRDKKCKLRAHWEQSNGNRIVQKTKEEVAVDRKWMHGSTGRKETAADLLAAKTEDREQELSNNKTTRNGLAMTRFALLPMSSGSLQRTRCQ